MTTEKISVIVPVYGAEKYLEQCVSSIRQQSYRNLEIILVDDGSKDRGGVMCDEYATEDDRIVVIHKENGGLSSAWQAGVKASTGKYLCFVDSDDWIDPDMIEKLAEKAGSTGSNENAGNIREMICCGFVIERENASAPEPRESAAPAGEYTGERLQKEIKEKILGNETRTVILSRCMKLISRELIEQNVHYCDKRVKMGEDVNVMVPAMLDTDRIVIIKGMPAYHYRYVETSMVHKFDPNLYTNITVLRDILKQVMTDKNIADGSEMADGEFLFLLFLELKNEIRRRDIGTRDVYKIFRDICEKEYAGQLLARHGKSISDPANKLLSVCIKSRNYLAFAAIRELFLRK